MTFVKGQSGNPGGKSVVLPDGRTLAELARERTPRALEALVEVLDDPESPAAAKVSAATAIMDRAFGRPKASIDIEVRNDEGAASLLEQARKRALTGTTFLPAD